MHFQGDRACKKLADHHLIYPAGLVINGGYFRNGIRDAGG